MEQDRRKIIIKEIDYWQKSKLLPDQYCDFLLNLYLDEDTGRPTAGWGGKAATAVSKSNIKQWILVFGLFSLVCLIALYFNAFHPLLQTALSAIIVLAFLAAGLRYRPRNEAAGLGLIGFGMLFMLVIGLYMLRLHDLETWGWTAAFLAFCALVWVVFGACVRIPALHFCGWTAAILVYALVLSKNTDAPSWYEVQLYWVPAAFVFSWFSWFGHRWSKQVAGVLFVTAVLLWFMPEVYSALFAENLLWLQMELITKIAMGGALLFTLRRHWIVWVA
jgi:hypothetical protein